MTLRDTIIQEVNIDTPVTPTSGETRIYVDTSTKTLHTVDDEWVVIEYAGKWYADTQLALKSNITRTINAQTGTTYTFDSTDAGNIVTAWNANPTTFTVDTNTNKPFAIWSEIDIIQVWAGKVTIAAAWTVTINSEWWNLSISAQYVRVKLLKTDTDVWILTGSLIA